MIVTVKKAEKMFCPMGAGSQDVVMCCGSRCMAWRHLDPEHGFCGMCPAITDAHLDVLDREFSEEF